MFLGFLRISAVKVPRGTDPTIQIFNDDVVAFTRLIDLMLPISTTFPYLSDRRLGDAEANHADGNCHSSECESDTAQSLLPGSQFKSLSHRSAFAPLNGSALPPLSPCAQPVDLTREPGNFRRPPPRGAPAEPGQKKARAVGA